MRKILVVDDHRLFLEGLRYLLKQLGDDVEVCECSRVQEAIDRLDRGERFTLTLIDLEMPELDGFALLHALKERRLSCPVVVISATVDAETIRRVLRNGALGFIPKHADADTMLNGLRAVLRGDVFLPDELWMLVSDQPIHAENPESESSHPDNAKIGDRQLEVLGLMAEGLTNKQIAIVLSVSEATVKYHIGVLFRALGVNSRTACIHEAQRRQMIKSESF